MNSGGTLLESISSHDLPFSLKIPSKPFYSKLRTLILLHLFDKEAKLGRSYIELIHLDNLLDPPTMEFLKYIEGFGLIDGVDSKIDYVCIKSIST